MKITLFLGTAATMVLLNTFVSAHSIDRSSTINIDTQPNSSLLNMLGVPVTLPMVQEELQIPPEHFPLLLSGILKRRPMGRLSVSGVWETTEGQLILSQGNVKSDSSAEGGVYLEKSATGSQILGVYNKRGGSIRGEFVTKTDVEGFWAQDYSDVACGREFYKPSLTTLWVPSKPTKYWGRLKFSFKSDGSFTGVYGYCEEDPKRSWTGKKNNVPEVN
jgi:hypothetical protein